MADLTYGELGDPPAFADISTSDMALTLQISVVNLRGKKLPINRISGAKALVGDIQEIISLLNGNDGKEWQTFATELYNESEKLVRM